MDSLRAWIRGHQVAAFFIFAFGMSWPLFVVILFLLPGNAALQGTLGSLAVYSPVLAGMVVASLSDSGPRVGQGRKRPLVFIIAWLFSALVLILFIWRVRNVPLEPGIAVFASILALLPAWVMSAGFSRISGVSGFLGTILRPRGNPLWYLIAFFTFPAVQTAGYLITRLFGGDPGEFISGGMNLVSLELIVLTFLNGFLYSGGINEESGWRGFAFPRLQKRFPPLAAALIVWVFWALWHLLYDIASGDSLGSILTNRLFFNLMWSILFVWVFKKSKGSILAPAIFHPSMNTFGEIMPRTSIATILFAAITVFAVISGRMWKKPSDQGNAAPAT